MDLSLLEISHRSKEFEAVMAEAEQLVRELLSLNDDFAVLFLSGGASSQFYMVPMNLLGENEKAYYINTGTWATGAIKEARLLVMLRSWHLQKPTLSDIYQKDLLFQEMVLIFT